MDIACQDFFTVFHSLPLRKNIRENSSPVDEPFRVLNSALLAQVAAVSRALAAGTRSFRKSPALEVKNRFCFCGRRLRQPRRKGEARRIRAGILPAFRGPEASGLNYQVRRSASIASMSKSICFAKASSSHHSSGGFGIEVSPEP